ncbi:hypothetical protein GCM10023116_44460 [Kistimonas scapharcae]|uniref:DUF6160 domain-containing protein n=1 Tax=Kistimonas scapharcae TaxID=1036133 RepID=A0ABP8V8M7_9GAMM
MMNRLLRVKCFMLIFPSIVSQADLVAIADEDMTDISGQAGITVDLDISASIDEIRYTNTENPESAIYPLVMDNVTADFQVSGLTTDLVTQIPNLDGSGHTAANAIRFGMDTTVNINDLGFDNLLITPVDASSFEQQEPRIYRLYAANHNTSGAGYHFIGGDLSFQIRVNGGELLEDSRHHPSGSGYFGNVVTNNGWQEWNSSWQKNVGSGTCYADGIGGGRACDNAPGNNSPYIKLQVDSPEQVRIEMKSWDWGGTGTDAFLWITDDDGNILACAGNQGGCYKNSSAGSVGISENLSDGGQGYNWQTGSGNGQDEYVVLTLGPPDFEPSQPVLGLQVQGSFQTTGSIYMIPR